MRESRRRLVGAIAMSSTGHSFTARPKRTAGRSLMCRMSGSSSSSVRLSTRGAMRGLVALEPVCTPSRQREVA